MSDPLEPTDFSVRMTDNIAIIMISTMVAWILFSTYCNQSREVSETESSLEEVVGVQDAAPEAKMTAPE